MTTIFTNLQINNAEQFISSLSSNTQIYLTFGKSDAWSNEAEPATANASVGSVYEVWANMIGAKKVLGGDVHHVIPRHNWTANTVYYAYDHKTPNLFDANIIFSVITSDYSVYKCLSNNNGVVSTTEPSALNTEATTFTADGYVWKYMYTVPDSEQLRFTTENYIPVKTLVANDGSLQWQVQDNATNGSIEHIILNNPGSLYSNANSISVTITGDGSSASATASINTTSNTISTITITESGSNYTYADITISDTGTGSGANAVAIISPVGGHGSDPLYELGGKNIIINTRLRYDEEGVLPVSNDFRQIALIKNPYEYSSTANTMTDLAFLQAMALVCDGSNDYILDELVYQGVDQSTATFTGRVVSWDDASSELLLINTIGTPTLSQAIIGASSFTTRIVATIENGACEPYSGKILYLDNIDVITRSDDQIEDFKIVLSF